MRCGHGIAGLDCGAAHADGEQANLMNDVSLGHSRLLSLFLGEKSRILTVNYFCLLPSATSADGEHRSNLLVNR